MTTLIIGKAYTAQDLGFYTRGQSLASFPSTNISGILQSVTYPVLSKMQGDDNHLIASYRKLISMTSMVVFWGMFLLAALAKPLIITLLTDKWMNAVIYLQIFCFGYMFDHICSMNLNILYVKGYSDLVLKLEVIKKTISITMILIAIPMGPLAICIAGAIYTQIAVVINTYYTGKLFNLGYFKQVKDVIKYFVFSAVASIPAFLLSFTLMHNIWKVIIGVLISAFIYYLLLRKDKCLLELLVIFKDCFFHKVSAVKVD